MMIPFEKLALALLCLLPLSALRGQSRASVEARLASSMVVVGEETYLTLITQGLTVIDWPDRPADMAPLALQRDAKRRFQINGYIREGFRYRVSAFEPGVYRIPPFEFPTRSGVVRSEAQVLRVFAMEELATHGIKIGGSVTPYLTGVFFEKTRPFVGEQQTVEAKLYLSQAPPNRLSLADGKVINFNKKDLAARRFTTQPEPTGVLNHQDQRYQVYTYRSSLGALREGPLTFGPGQAEAVFFFRARPFIKPVKFPAVELEVQPLPEGAPPGFEGAVGRFSMSVQPLGRELELGDALTVEIEVSGTGNLHKFPGPSLVDPEGDWKQLAMTAKPAGEERRQSSGTAEFSQLLRPLSAVEALPPYRFVFFDPLTTSYQVRESPPIKLTITGALSEGPDGSGGLGFLTPGDLPMRSFEPLSPWMRWGWQLIPAGVLLVLLAQVLKRRRLARRLAQGPQRELDAAIASVAEKVDDRVLFYREASRIATRWQGGSRFDPLYQKRDEVCFRPDATPTPVEPSEKNKVLKLLHSLTPLLLAGIIFLLQTGPVHALPEDPAQAKEEILAAMAEKPAPEHFHNLALCEQALDRAGAATLWAYRFKLHGGEADPLLRGLPGSREKEQGWPADWIAVVSRDFYLQLIFAGGWSLILLLAFLFTQRSTTRAGLLAGLGIFGGVALALGSAAWFWYPQEISAEPLQHLSVVTGNESVLSAPFEGARAVRDTPVGSLCKVTARRAGWARVIFPGGFTGWIQAEEVTDIHSP